VLPEICVINHMYTKLLLRTLACDWQISQVVGGGQNVVLVVLVDWFVLAVRSYLELHVWLLYF
jgi:hypothetical protein